MSNSKLPLREYVKTQEILAKHSPWHLRHLLKETGRDRDSFTTNELMMHFAGHQNHYGRSFASIFAKIYRRYQEEILSDDNIYFAGIFLKRNPTLVEATLYYFAYRRKFGLSLERLLPIVVKID